jgi:hypothetical protein
LDELILLAIINVESQPFSVSANLMGLLLINQENGLGMQLVLHDSPYLARQPLTLKTMKLFMEDGLLGLPEWKILCCKVPMNWHQFNCLPVTMSQMCHSRLSIRYLSIQNTDLLSVMMMQMS